MLNVLIVDDNQTNAMLMASMVAQIQDATPVKFSDAMSCLEWCTSHQADLILVDYMMPNMNGLEFIDHFRRMPGCDEVPVVMVTSFEEKELKRLALEKTANDFISKPIDMPEFMARTSNMLSLRQGQLALKQRAYVLEDEVNKATAQILAREREAIFRLCNAAEYRDQETGAHILRIAHYSKLIAAELGLSSSDQELIYEASPMHDIGKVGIPDSVLLKPGKLTDEEFSLMKTHTTIGYEILKGSDSSLIQTGALIALNHHEKFDGSGYPNGLKGEAIPLAARIVAVVDVYDALTSSRPYKTAWSHADAREFIHASTGGHFDPVCVDAFNQVYDAIMDVNLTAYQ